ncbi:uroporphyrinogen-III synthase [Flavobacterium humi]|uniref:Uroporphyrinogen-III synthase n=1 Tax=Flavobacterium humi TaxID=2562683 RepID=A0A4Z0L862_9FLAO|nr:uroporphyrinogen-III synthase [Flavobacterium humi]TGD58713.1 uroporphyrinogen-III synthase [Flavobacterium humi]
MQNQIRIVSTKKLLSNQKQYLLNADFNVIEADFIKTHNKPFDLNHINNNLIFTSQNAVLSVLEHEKADQLKSKNAFCVGLKTKELLEKNGFNVMAYTGYAQDLAEIIALVYTEESYTFFSGNLRRDTLPDALKRAHIQYNEITVYETLLTPQKINAKADGILFFSPSAVESFLKENTIKNEICFCIGNTTAEALETNKIKNIVIANQPTVENTIIQCLNEFK